MSVDLSLDAGVAEIVLNRPDRLNAIDAAHFSALTDTLDRALDRSARAILLRGEGRSFCAGRDVAEIDPDRENAGDTLRRTFNALVMKLGALPVPSVAAVQGPCLGAGTGIALACDLVVAAEDASFASPFGRLGSVPDSGFHWFVTSRLGAARAKDLVLTGRAISGSEAEALGLVARSVPAVDLESESRDLARSIAAGPTRALALACDLVDRAADGASLAEILQAEATAQSHAFETADLREGLAAFADKREPVFRGA